MKKLPYTIKLHFIIHSNLTAPFEEKINELFRLENASNLPYKNSCVKFDTFSRRNDSFIFPPKQGA